jgi:ubiquinone/menaquinone biosynthesis C-methylase UbiE
LHDGVCSDEHANNHHGRERAKADRLRVTFLEADAEDLPFESGSFDVVLSTFGVMFVPDHEKAASELLRVCPPAGRIGLASWTPKSFIGRLFRLMDNTCHLLSA